MDLEYRVKSLDDVPEALKEFYREDNGAFVLSAKGAAPKERVDEFRNSNIELKKQIEDFQTKFADIDPEKYRELTDKAQKERDKKLVDSGKIEELVNDRVNAMKAQHDKELKAVTEREATVTKQLEGLLIDGAAKDAAIKAGVRASAIDDVVLNARGIFRLQDGKAVPMVDDKPLYGKNGDIMTAAEWVASLTETKPHYFEPSKGGGSNDARPTTQQNGHIDARNTKAFLANLDNVAAGKAQASL